MAVKLVRVCVVCGGWARFLNDRCPKCKGKGGGILKITKEIYDAFLERGNSLSEQEKALFNFYKMGFSQKEIAKNLDIQVFKVILLLYSIEKKLNEVNI